MKVLYKAFLIFLSFPFILNSQPHNIRFEGLSSFEGLESTFVRCITQDYKGFLWFGTQNGLYRYDGYNFRAYRHDPDDPFSISYNWIHTICPGKSGNLWIGTYGGGLNKFDTNQERFFRYHHDMDNPYSLCNDYIISMYEDHRGDLWIATQKGLSRMLNSNPDSGEVKFINYYHNPQNINSLSHNYVWSIYESSDRSIWVGTHDGTLHRFNENKQNFFRVLDSDDINTFLHINVNDNMGRSVCFIYHNPSDLPQVLTIGTWASLLKYDYQKDELINIFDNFDNLENSIDFGTVRSLFIDTSGSIWAATTNGCYIIDPIKGQIVHYKNNPIDAKSIAACDVIDIYQDKQGIIWFAFRGCVGIQKYNKWTQDINHYTIIQDTIEFNVTSIFEDLAEDKRILWLGTARQGLIRYDRKANQIEHFIKDINGLISVICQSPDDLNNLWIGTIRGGLYKIDIKNGSSTNYIYRSSWEDFKNEPNSKDLISTASITSIQIDKNGHLWLGSLRGLYKFNPLNNQYTSYLHDPQNPYSISSNQVSALCRSISDSVLWIGTRTGGLNKLDMASGKFYSFKHNPEDPLSLNANYVNSILEDSSENLWIGTPRGLSQYNRSDGTFIQVQDEEKKLNTEILHIMADKPGSLYLSTRDYLHKFNTITRILRSYNIRSGRWACHQSKSGELFFARGTNLTTFHPDNIKANPYVPPIVFTDFHIFNESVKVSPTRESPLQKSIIETEQITLSHDQSVFSFEFASLDYSDPAKNKYAYKMEGVDPDWVYTDANRRYATYTQLDPGEYLFHVKGSNNDGIWNEEGTSIKITILPPWWRTTWAYFVYTFLIILTLYGLRRYDLKRQRLKHELELEHLHAEKIEELDRLKSRFFTNISHEFRTPLTLILGPVKQILTGEFVGNIKEQYKMIIRNGERLLQLINQLLDLSKLESGKLKLKARPIDIIYITKGLVSAFKSLALQRNINLNFKSDTTELEVYLDQDKYEQIINNLLSNAFKFMPERGKVEVCVENPPQSPFGKGGQRGIVIKITNTGPAIPPEEVDKIFDRFYQADSTYKKDSEGTGIGLAITKELVELHHGSITVESNPGKGTIFTILLPVGRECFKEDEIVATPIVDTPHGVYLPPDTEITSPIDVGAQNDTNVIDHTSKPSVLIVEDNADMHVYLANSLDIHYQIIEAKDGKQGLQKAISEIPDLIISDVMMPKMDGFELCKKLKTDERTNHIPVILLTARAAKEDKIEGLETGADDYIPKPFDAETLLVRVKNLVEQRKKLRELFNREAIIPLKDFTITSMDDNFIKHAMAVITRYMSDPDFTVQTFYQELGMSRTQLYRKIKALTNQSPHMFIRLIRLKRAAILLKRKAGNVAEVAYEVGYNSPAHFSKAFREQFGQAPSEFTANLPH